MIDWETWTPTETAVLLFVVRGDEILLIRKKRGLGAGKVNAPGGRVDPGETPLEAAKREIQEELCVRVDEAREMGDLSFQFRKAAVVTDPAYASTAEFTDGYKLRCHVFRADDCDGQPTETPEAAPLWTKLDAIPFDEMWQDDRHWLPLLLAGKRFRGRFVFDGEEMITCDLATFDAAER